MMEYIDTNILISVIDKNDKKYVMANNLIKNYHNKVITELNVMEMKSVLSRIDLTEEEIEALIKYLFIKTDIKLINLNFNESLEKAEEIVNIVKLKTLDCMHIANAIILNASKFITFDKDFKIKESFIKKYGIEIINPL